MRTGQKASSLRTHGAGARRREKEEMGTFEHTLEIEPAQGGAFLAVEALVDTGATFSRLPADIVERLGYVATRRKSFVIADGRTVEMGICDVKVRMDGETTTTPVMIGDVNTQPLIGAVTLEQFLVAPDPVNQKLIKVEGLLMMALHGKKYTAAAEKLEPEKNYEPKAAIALLKQMAYAQFDETVELHIRTGLDSRHAEQQLRGTIVLPHGLGKSQRVLVFAEGEGLRIAEEAGADEVGGDALVKKVEGGYLDFQVALATKEMMGKVGRLGRVLGPRGLMPNPRTNTVVEAEDLPRAIRDAKQGRVEFRTDRTNLVHVPFGKISFSEEALYENFSALLEAIVRGRPSGAKGQYIRSITVTTTMSPGVRLDPQIAAEMGSAAA
jgi:large subunit ribosomal protein L1